MTSARTNIAFVGQLPPPFHGQAIANECLLKGDYESIELHPIRVDLSDKLSDVGKARFSKLSRLWETNESIQRAAAQFGGHTVYYSMGFTNLLGATKDAILLRKCRKHFRNVIVHLHTGSVNLVLDKFGALAKLSFGRLFSSVDAWILLSPHVNQFGSLFEPRKVYYLPNGVQVPSELHAEVKTLPVRLAKDVPTILFMSNLFESKGTDILLRAAGVLRRQGARFRVKLVGNWPSKSRKSELETVVREEQLQSYVDLVGPLIGDAKWYEMQQADVFCLPTHYSGEVMPLSIIEALACGTPVVSTNWRAVPDLIQDGVNGFVIPCRDVEALASRLALLINDSELRTKLGANARRSFVQKHTTAQFQANYEDILTEIIGNSISTSLKPTGEPTGIRV